MLDTMYTLRLTSAYDADLICASSLPNYSFPKFIRDVLKAYVGGETLDVVAWTADYPIKKVKSKAITLYLDSNEDADVIDLLNSLPNGVRCAFVKYLLRRAFYASLVSDKIDFSYAYLTEGVIEDKADKRVNPEKYTVRKCKPIEPEPVVESESISEPVAEPVAELIAVSEPESAQEAGVEDIEAFKAFKNKRKEK